MRNIDEINAKIDELRIEKEKWDKQLEEINSGKAPNLPPYSEMVLRHIAMYANQLQILMWCVGKDVETSD